MMVVSKLSKTDKLTPEQLEQIRLAAQKAYEYDPECPPMTEEQLSQFKRVYPKAAGSY